MRSRHIASTCKVLTDAGAPPPMVALTDLLGETVMKWCRDHDAEPVAGRYVIELRADGSLMSMRAAAERWEPGEADIPPPAPDVLAAMYAQIRPSAEAYFAECGDRPPLAADMYDLLRAQGYDLSMVERTDGARVMN